MRTTSLVFALAATLAVTWVGEREARACGGCFHPPTESNSVITDHRMVLSVSKTRTTLYDQIQYQGSPSEFAWVLPINGEATVGLSADALFAMLDGMTATVVEAPDLGCPAQPADCLTGLRASAPKSADESAGGGVTVTKHEVVGPYETVQLKSSDPQALNAWLATNGFAVPEDVRPIIKAYVNERSDFLALKLRPGANIKSMRPVRVTTAGGSPVLPLRMVAAGTGAKVGITLWVLGEGRYQPRDFPNFQILDSELVWDWSNQTSNYKDLRARRGADGKSWETESSVTLQAKAVANAVRYGYFGGGSFGGAPPQASSDYEPSTDAEGRVLKTADQVREEDLEVLLSDLTTLRATRLRADLAHAALATDLALQPSADQAELPGLRKAKGELGQPMCTVYNGCQADGQLPRDQAIARSSTRFGCSASPVTTEASLSLVTLAGFLGYAFIRSRRRGNKGTPPCA